MKGPNLAIQREVKILWTGGWDSSFRVAWLMAQAPAGTVVQPYYVIDTKRASVAQEVRAIARIGTALRQRFADRLVTLNPVALLDRTDAPHDENMAYSYRAVRARFYVGEQYGWLGQVLVGAGLDGVELCIHQDDIAHSVLATAVTHHDDDLGGHYRVSESARLHDVEILFGRYCFPVFDWCKTHMQEWAKTANLADVLSLSWFCHTPKRGRACGTCGPCIFTLREGMSHRLSRYARLRYAFSVKRRIRSMRRWAQLLSSPQ